MFFVCLLKTLIVGTCSNKYPQSMFWFKNKKNRYTPVNPSFTYIKVGYEGLYISWTVTAQLCPHLFLCFRMCKKKNSFLMVLYKTLFFLYKRMWCCFIKTV